ncbi:hypothetical protein [Treponema phagedenis]|uniref:hypothetical protein n=1 Tax=Treponema phagedenis TaxID=162 RepID=UPI0011E67906|nr:hypothetical protein [Treponema phagedenis]QEK00229.1 hypothetical protein FUT84_02915 [Treponema phagedenis]QEK00238.1 hypothetical protein FUT84_02960 [Treponema phagedenis]QEK07723.1 hypothetical protein FUT80_14020 [Treponema phagedenis]QEK07732.1 hypothetical protein FUT80_14065 [Treponema phagedenis]
MFSGKVYDENDERNVVEKCCFDNKHVENVCRKMEETFEQYFQLYLETKAGKIVSQSKIKEVQEKFGVKNSKTKNSTNLKDNFIEIQSQAIDDFEKDREKYEAIFDGETLDEYADNPVSFKSVVLKNECPIIHKTLANRLSKELDRYRAEFNRASAEGLLDVVCNLHNFGIDYSTEIYNPKTYDSISKYEDLHMEKMSTDELTYYGVIGGGIKSHMLFKIYPHLFPNRSQSAIWALWFLTKKNTFGCKMDSEFLMIDEKRCITQQNYFYPYQLFVFYAFRLYKMIKEKAQEFGCKIENDYRYVMVDSFLNFVADQHEEEIKTLKHQITDDGIGF